MPTQEEVMKALEIVKDPEIGYNIVDLGLVYDVDIEAGRVDVTMTLTAPGCPAAEMITSQARAVVRALPGVDEAEIHLVYQPFWTPDRMSPRLKKMREMGIY